jgi:RNA polymerase sigma factor (TIGR02999 family)
MPSNVSQDITGLLIAWRGGDSSALGALMPATYRKLKAVAARLLRTERGGHTLETTALVHEAYIRLVDLNRIGWQDRAHFYAMSARLMRQILVDHARARARLKRGSDQIRISIDELQPKDEGTAVPDLVALDDALRDLAALDTERARVVELRFFGGLDREEIGEVMGLSSATVSRRWRAARAWLLRYLKDNRP